MVRFLYEFGAFVKNEKDNNVTSDKVWRSGFHCYVIDKEMKTLAGTFAAQSEAIKSVLNPEDENKAQESLISLYDMDCQSMEFFESLKCWLPTINYVVLATGDDELNMSQAVRIFKLAIRYRSNLDHFRIMVRVQHDNNGHFKRISDHYNRMWAAECNSSKEEKKLHQNVIKATVEVDGPITLFGSTESIYTANHIINEELKEIAKKFKTKYDTSLFEHQKAAGLQPYPIVSWDEEQNDAMQLTGKYKGYSPTYTGLLKLRRTQRQNYANSLHIMTKVVLARKALRIGEDYCLQGLIRRDNEMTYVWDDTPLMPIESVQRVMDVLAQTEHLRWVASHEIRGYQRDQDNPSKRDESRLLHQYLCDWSELPHDTRSFDYNAVDVSLKEKGLIK